MNKETLQKSDELFKAMEIADQIVKDESIKAFHAGLKGSIKSLIAEGKLTSVGVRYGVNEFLGYWNEAVGVDIEVFWKKLRENGIKYERKEPLRHALKMGRFRNVHQGMETAKNFNSLLEAKLLEPGYSTKELDTLSQIIELDTTERVKLLSECLKKSNIPSSKYLRFGDSAAYMSECGLWSKYFTENEIKQLMEIWQNFK